MSRARCTALGIREARAQATAQQKAEMAESAGMPLMEGLRLSLSIARIDRGSDVVPDFLFFTTRGEEETTEKARRRQRVVVCAQQVESVVLLC
jgi:hypothetical protein